MQTAIAETITIRVIGKPAPGGSKNGFGFRRKDGSIGVNIVESSKGNAGWRRLVQITALTAMACRNPFVGPVVLDVVFVMPRPKAHFNTKGGLHPWAAAAHHISTPDTTKLVRSTEDALKSIVWIDDNQVVIQHAKKRYRGVDERPGAIITVRVAPAADAAEWMGA